MRHVYYTEWWINYLYAVAEVTASSCEDIIEVFCKEEERFSVREVTKKVREEEKAVPACSQTE